MSDNQDLCLAARQAAAVIARLQGDPPAGGSLTVIGTGIRAITQLSLESLAAMVSAEVLLHVVGEPVQEAAIAAINPAAETMTNLYADGVERSATYEAMIDRIVGAVVDGKRTVAAFYGHPGVFTWPTHESVRRGRAAGYPARMLPAVSSADCMYADLGIDPGDGCQAYEATDFLYRSHPVDAAAHLFLWKVGAIGNSTYESAGYALNDFPWLVSKLLHTYPAQHPVGLYEAAFDPVARHQVRVVPLAALRGEMTTLATTLHLRPVPESLRRVVPMPYDHASPKLSRSA